MHRTLPRVLNGLKRRVDGAREALAVRLNTKHLYGPERVHLQEDECVAVSLVKNAEYFLEGFLDHHFNIGASYVVLLDNGSTDATMDIARSYDRVVLAQSHLPARRYECLLRKWAVRKFVSGGWILFVDSDEMFELPVGRRVEDLTHYCNRHGFTAVVTQMLDLFSPLSYDQLRSMTYAQSIEAANEYSLAALTRISYDDDDKVSFSYFLRRNRCDFDTVKLMVGGVRREIFGEECFLSKHSLVRNIDGIDLMSHPHCASGVSCADVTALLRHYKLTGAYLDRDRKSVAARTWDHGEDRRRVQVVGRDDTFAIKVPEPRRYRGPQALLDEGFLVCSERYRTTLRSSAA